MKKSAKTAVVCFLIAALASAGGAITDFVQGNYPAAVGSSCSSFACFCLSFVCTRGSQSKGDAKR